MTHFCRWKTDTLSEFVGNSSAVESLISWFRCLRAREDGTKRAALLVGPSGTGKNLVAELLFADGGFEVIKSDCSEVRTQKVFKEKLDNAASHSNVSLALGSHKSFAVLIDDAELLTPRNGLSELIHHINPLRGKRSLKQVEREWFKSYWPVPIVCISSCGKDDAKLADLKKDCELIVFEPIDDFVMWRAMETVAERENIQTDRRLLERVGGDFRKMLRIMSDLKMGIPLDNVLENHAHTRSCMSLKENTLLAFNNKHLTVQESIRLFDEDRHQLPQMIYENYPSKVKSAKDAQEVLENLCIADTLDSNSQELDTADGIARVHALLTIYCCNVVFSRCIEKLRTPKSTTAFSKTSAMHVTIKKIASIINSSRSSNLKLEDLQVLLHLDCESDTSFDEVGIKRSDLEKLCTKMPLKAN